MAILRFDEKHSHVPSFLLLSSNERKRFMIYKVRGTRIIDKQLIFMSFRQDIRNKYKTQLRGFTANDGGWQIHNFYYSTINRALYVLSGRALKKLAIILLASLARSRCHHRGRTSAPDRGATYIYIFLYSEKIQGAATINVWRIDEERADDTIGQLSATAGSWIATVRARRNPVVHECGRHPPTHAHTAFRLCSLFRSHRPRRASSRVPGEVPGEDFDVGEHDDTRTGDSTSSNSSNSNSP